MSNPAAGGPAQPARPLPGSDPRVARRRLTDRAARGVVVGGGFAIIASILAILFVIAGETFPLFRGSSARPAAAVAGKTEGAPLAFDVDEYRRIGCAVLPTGVRFLLLGDGADVRLPKDF